MTTWFVPDERQANIANASSAWNIGVACSQTSNAVNVKSRATLLAFRATEDWECTTPFWRLVVPLVNITWKQLKARAALLVSGTQGALSNEYRGMTRCDFVHATNFLVD